MKLMWPWERKVAVLANFGGLDVGTPPPHTRWSFCWGSRVSVPSLYPLGPGGPGLRLEARVRHLRDQAVGDNVSQVSLVSVLALAHQLPVVLTDVGRPSPRH